jgi:uncharacterized protein (DUF1800 family)
MSNSATVEIAYSRFGLGRTCNAPNLPQESARDLLQAEIDAADVSFPIASGMPTTVECFATLINFEKARQTVTSGNSPEMASQLNALGNPVAATLQNEAASRYSGVMMDAPIGFSERLVMFWANHFAVAVDKSTTVYISAGAYEREAIRPNVFGYFTDLVLAAETHPTMIYYLDNQNSTGPQSVLGRRGRTGLNENLAREIMELHVLGVGSGYSQADVTAFARVLTGWTASRNMLDDQRPFATFAFDAAMHEPGAQVILGKTYLDDGVNQGKAVLQDLTMRPETGRFIASKLVRHFIADTPPPALVTRLADTFIKTEGHLPAVYQALIESDEAWNSQRNKIRPPQEYMSAVLRATGWRPPPAVLLGCLMTMGQPLWQPSGPNGFSDTFATWGTPEGLNARMDVAALAAAQTKPLPDPRQFAETILASSLTPMTREAIARAETRTQGLSLALLSPELMRR